MVPLIYLEGSGFRFIWRGQDSTLVGEVMVPFNCIWRDQGSDPLNFLGGKGRFHSKKNVSLEVWLTRLELNLAAIQLCFACQPFFL